MGITISIGANVHWPKENRSGIVLSMFDTTVDLLAIVQFVNGEKLDIPVCELELMPDLEDC